MAFEIIWQVLIVLTLAVILGELFEQLRLPAVVGNLVSGLILGPTFLGLAVYTPEIQALSSIALFFIIFLIGFEMTTELVRGNLPRAVFVSLTSFIAPLLAAVLLAVLLFPFGRTADFLLALSVAVPSISIVSVMVMHSDLLQKESGPIILSSVVIADIIAFILLAVASESPRNALSVLLYVAIIIGGFALIDRILNARREAFQELLNRGSRLLKQDFIPYSLLIIVGLLVSFIFQSIGLSFIIGAFFAGLVLHEELIGREAFGRVARTFRRMNEGFFIPIFFGFAGVQANLSSSEYYLLVPLAAVLYCSIVASMVLTYLGGKRVLRMQDKASARQIAVIMGGRGAVGIVIGSVALGEGLINGTVYSLIIFGTLIVSMLVPLLLRRSQTQLSTQVTQPDSQFQQ